MRDCAAHGVLVLTGRGERVDCPVHGLQDVDARVYSGARLGAVAAYAMCGAVAPGEPDERV